MSGRGAARVPPERAAEDQEALERWEAEGGRPLAPEPPRPDAPTDR